MLNIFLGIFLALAAGAITNFFPHIIDKRNRWFPDFRKIRAVNLLGIIFSPLFIVMTYNHLTTGKMCIGGKTSTCEPGGTGTLFTRGIPDETMTYWLLIGIDVVLLLMTFACASLDFSRIKKENS